MFEFLNYLDHTMTDLEFYMTFIYVTLTLPLLIEKVMKGKLL